MEKRLAEIRDDSKNKKEIFTAKGAKKPLKTTLAPARGKEETPSSLWLLPGGEKGIHINFLSSESRGLR